MIQLIGIRDFEDDEKAVVDRIISEYKDKFERLLNNPGTVIIHFKKEKKQGDKDKAKYSIKLRVDKPKLEASSWDWELSDALHKVLKKVESEIRHRFKDNE